MSELFLNIFNTGIMAGWLVLAVVATRILLKKAPAWVKCALWVIVALRLVWPFEIESILSLIPSTQTLPPAELYNYAPQVHTGISFANTAINPVFTQVFASEPANSVNPLQVAVAIASVIWVIGMVAMVLYAAISYLRLRRRVRVSMPVGENVYLCDHISSPFILGVFRPRIYLPSDLPQEKWESILAHERAHLARRDHWWKLLGFVLLTVFWFHPLLWLAYILLCRDVELACDEKVIASLSTEEKQAYSEVLLECSVPKRWVTACPLAFGETGVKQRIKAVLHYKKPALWIIIAALIVGSVLAMCFLTEPKADNSDKDSVAIENFAGKTYIYEESEEPFWEFFLHIQQDGTFSYFEGIFSSYIGMGEWELKNGKLYLYDKGLSSGMTFVFTVEPNSLVFCADESDQFIYRDVADGERFFFYEDIEPVVQHLIFVDIVDIQKDYFIGVDVQGTRWKIHSMYDPITEDMKECWVVYYGDPHELDGEEAQYEINAPQCWLDNKENPQGKEGAYDYLEYDIDGDGVDENCYLTRIFSDVNGTQTASCLLSVWEGDVCEYEVEFDKLLVLPDHYIGLETKYGTYITPTLAYANVYAFAIRDDKLCIVSPSGSKYISTGEMKLFEVVFENGELRVVKEE